MSLSAFTNEPGNHTRYESVTGYQSGKYYGSDGLHEVIYNDFVPYEYVGKWYPTPSNHVRATNWSRFVYKVLEDIPGHARRYVTVGSPPIPDYTVDLMIDDHMSRHHRCGVYNVPSPGADNAYSESITKALNNLTQHYAGIGADLAQARQTCDMFSLSALRAGGFVKALRQRNFRQAFQNLFGKTRDGRIGSLPNTVADFWLEFNYGWKPLAKDLHELQLLAHDALQKPVPIMAHGNGKTHYEESFDYGQERWHCTSSTSYKTYLEANVTNPCLANLNSAGLINPFSIAWEVVPFSFVVDWFVPIGATLQAITAGVGLELNKGWTSSQGNQMLEGGFIPNFTGYGFGYVDPGSYREAGFFFSRIAHTSFPAPRLYADVTPYSTPRALNALALVSQLTSGKG